MSRTAGIFLARRRIVHRAVLVLKVASSARAPAGGRGAAGRAACGRGGAIGGAGIGVDAACASGLRSGMAAMVPSWATPIGVAQLGTIAAIPLRNPEAQAASTPIPAPPIAPPLPQAARPAAPRPPAGARAELATFKTSTAR